MLEGGERRYRFGPVVSSVYLLRATDSRGVLNPCAVTVHIDPVHLLGYQRLKGRQMWSRCCRYTLRMSDWTVEYYETADGHDPIREYLDSLPARDARAVSQLIDLLERQGISLGMPHARPIQGSRLWELRTRGSNHHRIFYVARSGQTFLLLHSFAKKTEKTPVREIRTAERRLADWEGRFAR